MDAAKQTLPNCTRFCGIVTLDLKPEKKDAGASGSGTERPDGTVNSRAQNSRNLWMEELFENERFCKGRVVVYTDGASRNNQLRDLRHAGYGAFWSASSPFNFARPLQGPHQTNQRAELQAVIDVLLVEKRPVEIRTDSKYVHDAFHGNLAKWKRASWRKGRRDI
eukprot:1958189-Karenia_brevis.AAC.1